MAAPWEKDWSTPAADSGKPWEKDWNAKAASPKEDAPTEKVRELPEIFGPAEAIRSMAMGAVAPLAGNVAGLGAMPLHAMGAINTDPSEVKSRVTQALTPPEPTTNIGKGLMAPAQLIGKGVNWVGEQAKSAIEPPPEARGGMQDPIAEGRRWLANAVGEGVNQAPGIIGPKGAATTASVLEHGAERSMRSALKPSLPYRQTGKSDVGVKTMLDEGINPTRGGRDELQTRVDNLNQRVKQVIDQAPPAMVNKTAVGSRVQEVIDKFHKQVNAAPDVAAAQKVWDNFLDNPLWKDQPGIPLPLAQEAKQGTYRALGEKAYGKNLSPEYAATRDAEKALARGLKEEIQRFAPQVQPLNQELQRYIPALKMTERRILQHANNNLAGLGFLAQTKEGFAAFMLDKSDLFKGLVAHMLHKGSKGAPSIMPAAGIATGGQAQELLPPPYQ